MAFWNHFNMPMTEADTGFSERVGIGASVAEW